MEPTTSASSLRSGPYRTRRRVSSRPSGGCREGELCAQPPGSEQGAPDDPHVPRRRRPFPALSGRTRESPATSGRSAANMSRVCSSPSRTPVVSRPRSQPLPEPPAVLPLAGRGGRGARQPDGPDAAASRAGPATGRAPAGASGRAPPRAGLDVGRHGPADLGRRYGHEGLGERGRVAGRGRVIQASRSGRAAKNARAVRSRSRTALSVVSRPAQKRA
jgi:hypothetical protein